MYPLAAPTCLDLKLEASGTLLIPAEVVTSGRQFGNRIAFLEMLLEDRATLSEFLNQVASQGLAPETAEP